jgi:aspartate/methionine/tyrosine aminotransferase
MHLEPFEMERLQSVWENRVDWNVSESGVQPLKLADLLSDPADLDALLAQELGYTQTNGTPELRALVAAMYPGATPGHVEITNGGSEANCVSLVHLVQPGDEIVLMVPNYMQAAGLARGLQGHVRPWPLVRDERAGRWRPDLDRLTALVSERTRAILICNPNNPTGARLTPQELDAIGRIADRVGAWVMSDEIYRGAELDGRETASMWGRAARVLVTSGLSKAYGLPGLRIGWVVGPPDVVDRLWGIHDYTSIAPGALSDRLARVALAPARRAQLLQRTRGILNANYPILRRWIDQRQPLLSHVAPEAGAIAFIRYQHGVPSSSLVERLRVEQSVLVVPGDHFEMDGYLRIGFGYDAARLTESLRRIGAVLDAIAPASLADAR